MGEKEEAEAEEEGKGGKAGAGTQLPCMSGTGTSSSIPGDSVFNLTPGFQGGSGKSSLNQKTKDLSSSPKKLGSEFFLFPYISHAI